MESNPCCFKRELQTVALKMWGRFPAFVWRLVGLDPRGTGLNNASLEPKHQNEL